LTAGAYFAHRDQSCRSIVITRFGDRDRSDATIPEHGAEGLALARDHVPVPHVVRFHSPLFLVNEASGRRLSLGGRVVHAMERAAARRAVLNTSASLALARTVSRAFGIPLERVRVVPSSIDHETFRPADGVPAHPPTVLYVGKITPLKGMSTLAEAIPLIVRRIPEVRVVLIGSDHVVSGVGSTVVYLGRLYPIKRPWLFFELARAMPDIEFVCLGQAHLTGEGSWSPGAVPDNLRMLGRLDGLAKIEVLASAWVLVNTSIHEALPMSFLEALACETPIVSCQPAGDLVDRYGIYVGRWDGTGQDGLPAFQQGVRRLLDDTELRGRLGRNGREWVAGTHNAPRFLAAVGHLLSRAGVRRSALACLIQAESTPPAAGSAACGV
jgi:glycosyltransferase involved in cell wall biosynthesis